MSFEESYVSFSKYVSSRIGDIRPAVDRPIATCALVKLADDMNDHGETIIGKDTVMEEIEHSIPYGFLKDAVRDKIKHQIHKAICDKMYTQKPSLKMIREVVLKVLSVRMCEFTLDSAVSIRYPRKWIDESKPIIGRIVVEDNDESGGTRTDDNEMETELSQVEVVNEMVRRIHSGNVGSMPASPISVVDFAKMAEEF